MEPPFERVVNVRSGRGCRDRGAHDDEHRDGQQREVVEVAEEELRHERHSGRTFEEKQKPDRDEAEADCDGNPGQKNDDRDEADDGSDDERRHGVSPSLISTTTSATYCRSMSPKPRGSAE